jgi:uncharacterized membrane protein
MPTPPIPFRRGAVEPIACISSAWDLVKPNYWLFVGMCAIGLMIGGAIPIVLVGPMMCGLYLSFFKVRRREPIEFGTLFKGFDFFGPSVLASALHTIPILAIIIPAYVAFYVGFILSVAVQSGSDQPNPTAFFGVFGLFICFWLAMFIVIIFISIGFTFAYPLIVDHKLSGMDAVKLSFKAAIANFWRLLGLMLLTGLLSLLGVACCYIGMFLVFPIAYASIAIAYEQVFGLSGSGEMGSDLPPPPPSF